MPRLQNKESVTVDKLTNAELEAELKKKKIEVDETTNPKEKIEAENELRTLNIEKMYRHDKQLYEKAHKNYSFKHKLFGAFIALCFCLSFPIVTAGQVAVTALLLVVGAYIGDLYRNRVIESGKKYRFKQDIDNLFVDIDNVDQKHLAEEKLSALKDGVDAATWKGYFNSFTTSWKYPAEFNAGKIQAITENEEVVNAIRNRK